MLFESTIKSEATRQTYRIWLNKFLKFTKIKDYDSLITLRPKMIQEILEDYLLYCRNQRKYSPNTIFVTFACLQSFFSYHVDGINFNRIRRMFPKREKTSGKKAYTTKQVRTILEFTQSKKLKACVHFMACSGVRVGALSEMKRKHLADMPNGCKSILVYADSIDEYTTFITPECFDILELYFAWRKSKGEKITDDSYLFVSPDGSKNSVREICSQINTIAKKSLEREKSSSGRYDVMSSHGLRKRFNTILKLRTDVNPNIAERLLGHSQSIRLDNAYFSPTIEQLFTEYEKVITDLSLSEKYRLEFQLKSEKAKTEKLEFDKDKRIEALEMKLEVMSEFLKEFKK
uniref:Integrase family protein (XerD) n=1 Tax=uncultured marine thaumarchaeote KM3_99_A02 TaxID=1456353 RepID=A0A075I5P0_9ARCH|nr:integrase family protein (xerD) [uncultured marine thaumarchaeote KM3_99_A02]